MNQQNLLEFAKYYINRDFEFWRKVVFTDGSKYNIFGYDGRENFREKEHEMNTKCFIPSVKNGICNGVWYNYSAGKIRIIY